jgi:hypothetical protein
MEEEIINEIKAMFEFNEAEKEIILKTILTDDLLKDQCIDISNDVYKDTNIDKWAVSLPILTGSKILMEKFIKHPINDVNILTSRQKTQIPFDTDIELLKDYENDVLWVFKIADEIKENSAIEILFPSSFIISYMNYIEQLLDIYHIYKIYIIPITTLLYPLSTIFVPYYYLNNYMHMNINLSTYLNICWNVVKMIFKSTGNLKTDLMRITTFILYVFLYVYSIYQTFEIALFLYDTKHKLHNKMSGLIKFVHHSQYILKTLDANIITPFFNCSRDFDDLYVHNSMTHIYRLWKEDGFKKQITSLLKSIYAVDVIDSIFKLSFTGNYSYPTYNNDKTLIWNAKNPVLNDTQVPNPVNLEKNIIITGPNAGGKTTYVKTILSNIILAQTFGITYSIQSNIVLYDTIHSFMRISDILGSKSYFEVEAEYCLNMMKKAVEISQQGKRGLFLMDEPMHSTPPTEGMATAYAVSEYLSKLPGISMIITTHFHKLVILEDLYPQKFINLSVDAISSDKKTFFFPYKIQRGHSFQCIAIELLDSKEFPQEVINNAIKMKNKICCELNK